MVHKMGTEHPKHEPVRDISDINSDRNLKAVMLTVLSVLSNSVLPSHQKQQLCLEHGNFPFGYRTNYPSSEWLSHAPPDIICQRCCHLHVKPRFLWQSSLSALEASTSTASDNLTEGDGDRRHDKTLTNLPSCAWRLLFMLPAVPPGGRSHAMDFTFPLHNLGSICKFSSHNLIFIKTHICALNKSKNKDISKLFLFLLRGTCVSLCVGIYEWVCSQKLEEGVRAPEAEATRGEPPHVGAGARRAVPSLQPHE